MATPSADGQAGAGHAEWLEQARAYLRDADPVLATLIADRPDFDQPGHLLPVLRGLRGSPGTPVPAP